MGIIIKAKCNECGFSQRIFFGAGKMTFKEKANFPAINKKTGEFEIINIKNKELLDQYDCYCSEKMYEKTENTQYHVWGDEKIAKTKNLCPHCGKFTMDFMNYGRFD